MKLIINKLMVFILFIPTICFANTLSNDINTVLLVDNYYSDVNNCISDSYTAKAEANEAINRIINNENNINTICNYLPRQQISWCKSGAFSLSNELNGLKGFINHGANDHTQNCKTMVKETTLQIRYILEMYK